MKLESEDRALRRSQQQIMSLSSFPLLFSFFIFFIENINIRELYHYLRKKKIFGGEKVENFIWGHGAKCRLEKRVNLKEIN